MTKISDALRHTEGEGESVAAPAAGRTPRATSLLTPSRSGRAPGNDPVNIAVEKDLLTLRTTIETLLPAQTSRCIAFVSPRGGEGTTTLLRGFARLVAADPTQTVAMIDANFLRPQLGALHNADAAPGLADVLNGSAVLSAAAYSIDQRTHVLPAGHADVRHLRPDTPTMDRVLAAFGAYSFVLLDCAPLLSWPQGAACAAAADGVIVVVEWGRTKREVVQRGIEMLAAARANILGVVMNRRRYPIPEAIYRRV